MSSLLLFCRPSSGWLQIEALKGLHFQSNRNQDLQILSWPVSNSDCHCWQHHVVFFQGKIVSSFIKVLGQWITSIFVCHCHHWNSVLVLSSLQENGFIKPPFPFPCFKLCLHLRASLCGGPISALSAQSDMGGSSPSSSNVQAQTDWQDPSKAWS